MGFWNKLFGNKATQKHANMRVGDVVPASGRYYCSFCSAAHSALQGPLSKYAKEQGLNSGEIAAVFAAVGGSKTPQERDFKKGETFGKCPECGNAASWCME